MKHRRGFVTNSSSSSFVLAVRNGATESDIAAAIDGINDKIAAIVSDYRDCTEEEISLEEAKQELVQRIFNIAQNSPLLDNWKVCSVDGYNDGDICEAIFYELDGFQSENVKIL